MLDWVSVLRNKTRLAFLINLISEESAENIIKNITKFYPCISISQFSDEQILSLMMNDKKNSDGNINFALLKNIGESVYDVSVPTEKIINSLHFYQKLS